MAVCQFCQSTLVRRRQCRGYRQNGGAGRRRQPDPLRHGRALQRPAFGIVGRIQQQYEGGYWNEWYLLFDDQREGWLSEGSGQFYLTFPVENKGSAAAVHRSVSA